jgi:hypothetical protein
MIDDDAVILSTVCCDAGVLTNFVQVMVTRLGSRSAEFQGNQISFNDSDWQRLGGRRRRLLCHVFLTCPRP